MRQNNTFTRLIMLKSQRRRQQQIKTVVSSLFIVFTFYWLRGMFGVHYNVIMHARWFRVFQLTTPLIGCYLRVLYAECMNYR